MKNKIIEIVYLATGSYKNFIGTFIHNIKLFFPGYKKILTIISDGLEEYNDIFICDDIIMTKVHKIMHLPYPFITYFKYNYINEFCTSNSDYLFYFDADTVFIDNPNINWENIIKTMNNSVIVSNHIFYAFDDNNKGVESLFKYNTEKNQKYSTYIDKDVYNYVIGSFFGGDRIEVKHLCDEIINNITNDLKNSNREWYIPKFIDEAYLNSVAENKNVNIIKDQFVLIYYNDNILMKYNNAFCLHKCFSTESKKERIVDSFKE